MTCLTSQAQPRSVLRPHRRLHRPNTQPSGLHPCPCVTGPTLPCTFPCCSMPQACLQPRRNATGDRALPSMNGGLPLSMRCGHAPVSPCKSFPQLWSMSPWLSRPRFCTGTRRPPYRSTATGGVAYSSGRSSSRHHPCTSHRGPPSPAGRCAKSAATTRRCCARGCASAR